MSLVNHNSENDATMRVIGAAESGDADAVVEMTEDFPIISPQIVEQAIRLFKGNQAVGGRDYARGAG